MAEWCQKCGTYHDITTAGGCPSQEDKLWVGTYAEGFRAGQEARCRAPDPRVAALVEALSKFAKENDYCLICDNHPSSGHSPRCALAALKGTKDER